MNYEIKGPEQIIMGGTEAAEIAMPGQMRIPKDIAISKHVAQFLSVGMIRAEEERRREELIQGWKTAINRARSPKRLGVLKEKIREWYIYGNDEGPTAVLLTDQADTRLARMSMRTKNNKHGR